MKKVKGSRVITLYNLTSTEIYSMLISKVLNKPSSIFTSKICFMTITLTRQQSVCYQALLGITLMCDLFSTKS